VDQLADAAVLVVDGCLMNDLQHVFAALSDPTRLELVRFLVQRGPSTATELSGTVPISRQAVSKHLASLAGAGLVTRRRSGRDVRYVFEPGPLSGVVDWVQEVDVAWASRLDRLRGEFE
jgi:DNA-binding transcriptional ArsR family regulator